MFALKLLAVDKSWPVFKNMVSLGQSYHGRIIRTINNMKQNFYDFNEYGQGGVNHLDTARHDCKVFSNNPFANSVCRNCCFSDNCTDGWQPSTFEDWNIQDRREVKKQMQLFDQFVYAPGKLYYTFKFHEVRYRLKTTHCY